MEMVNDFLTVSDPIPEGSPNYLNTAGKAM
jgi:hypothetical protein